MMILPNASQMRAIDRCAINEFGIPGIVLMENAGLGTVLKIEQKFGSLRNASIPIFIGPGNNGGDGLVIARHLLQRNARPLLVFLVDPDGITGDSATNLEIVKHLHLPTCVCKDTASVSAVIDFLNSAEFQFGSPRCYIDAVFGTGLCRQLEGHFSEIIEYINKRSSTGNIPVVAVDTPSGLNSDDGSVLGVCVEADLTATYGYAKIGQKTTNGKKFTGDLHVIDIGIPADVPTRVPVSFQSIDHSSCSHLLPQLQRDPDSHKGSYGHLLVIGGSAGKTGAAVLAGCGALRSGCGLVSLCCPKDLNPIYETALTEAMTIPLESETAFNRTDFGPIMEHAAEKEAVVLGPGIGQEHETAELVIELYNNLACPVVVDADALNIIAAQKERLQPPPAARILTPHPGEMARLLATDTAAVQANRIDAARQCVERFGSASNNTIAILKGADTLVADSDQTAINSTGNPGMAAGGMGDVLSGMIGSFLCQGMLPYDAACFAVFLHGLCGDRRFKNTGIGFTATELADDIGSALLQLHEQEMHR